MPRTRPSLAWMAPFAIVLVSGAPALAQSADYQTRLAAY
jgi:hypothetical protein